MTGALERAARAVNECDVNGSNPNRAESYALARAVLMAVLVSVETDMSDPFQADDRFGTVVRAILNEEPK